MADIYVKRMSEIVKSWNLDVFEVANYEYVSKISETKTAEPRNPLMGGVIHVRHIGSAILFAPFSLTDCNQ